MVDGLINFAWRVVVLLILVRVVLSWRRNRFSDPVGRWVYFITEPLLRPCRLLVDTRKQGYDIAPVVAWILLWIIRGILKFIF